MVFLAGFHCQNFYKFLFPGFPDMFLIPAGIPAIMTMAHAELMERMVW